MYRAPGGNAGEGGVGSVSAFAGDGGATSLFGFKKASGSALKRSLQRGPQKKYVVPACSWLPPRAFVGSTFIPQTGSITFGGGTGSAVGTGSSVMAEALGRRHHPAIAQGMR
jgi:hypothetical protein